MSDNAGVLITNYNSAQRARVCRNTPLSTFVLSSLVSNFKVSGDMSLIKQACEAILDGAAYGQNVTFLLEAPVLEKYLAEDL